MRVSCNIRLKLAWKSSCSVAMLSLPVSVRMRAALRFKITGAKVSGTGKTSNQLRQMEVHVGEKEG